MPELPEVETVCRALGPHLIGRRINGVEADCDRLRLPVRLEQLRLHCTGRTIRSVRRRGKFLIVELDQLKALVLHLGMTGAFRVCPASEPARKHEHVFWELDNRSSWRLVDARRFGSVITEALAAVGDLPGALRGLGPDATDPTLTEDYLVKAARGRKRPIKNLILDQAVLAGIGNIYASEVLFRAGINPMKPSGALSLRKWSGLLLEIRATLEQAIEAGGTTIRNFHSVDGTEGSFKVALNVYGREGQACPRCGPDRAVSRVVMAGRSTFFCPACQK